MYCTRSGDTGPAGESDSSGLQHSAAAEVAPSSPRFEELLRVSNPSCGVPLNGIRAMLHTYGPMDHSSDSIHL